MTEPRTVVDLVERIAGTAGTRPALEAPGRSPLGYSDLATLLARTGEQLRGAGFDRSARLALVLPNGPELAAAVYGVAAFAAAAPLNPAYRREEFDFFLDDLDADALVVMAGDAGPAGDAARARDIPVIELRPDTDLGAGGFRLDLPNATASTPFEAPQASDTAILLHTSGTTSRSKLVPLSQANICASAHNVRTSLALTEADRCLNIMPLFHIHGLIAGVLASFAAGATVVCPPGFNALKIFTWLSEAQPSWITAVPTMHQAILARAARNPDALAAIRLRLLRSSSAALPAPVMAELEAVFDAPVIESYGMTEAAHQMTSNPLPPATRKPGSVGLPAGPEVAIMDAAGRPLAAGETGEIVIRGANVTVGYDHNPEANDAAFTRGWFRTGDLGAFESGGYLSISGRLKEIINRGGEKISPREVDEVLTEHPAIAQAVAFAVPHTALGQDIAAAIVLREGADASEQDIRGFAAERLADFKVPRRILILDAIPTGATGKLQRIGLAKKLGLTE